MGISTRITPIGIVTERSAGSSLVFEVPANLTDAQVDTTQFATSSISVLVKSHATSPSAITQMMISGDSNGVGSNPGGETGYSGGWRTSLYVALRRWRSDFNFVGPVCSAGPELSPTMALWFHNCVAGRKIEDITASVSGAVATSGVPDWFVDSIGTNNIAAAESLVTLQEKRRALDAAYVQWAPNSRIAIIGVTPFVSGTSTVSSLGALQSTQASYNAWLSSSYAPSSGGRIVFIDATSALGPGDFLPDGVHLNRGGQAHMGSVAAQALDKLFGYRRGISLPRSFKFRKPIATVSMSSADSLQMPIAPKFSPGTGSFAFALDYYPTMLNAGSNTIAQYNSYGSTNFWSIYQSGQACNVYFDNAAGTIFSASFPSTLSLRLNKWHRIVFIAHAQSRTVGLYVNGKAMGVTDSQPVWNMSVSASLRVGSGQNFAGAPGYYSRIHSYRSNDIPQPGTMAAILAVEGDYFEDIPLCGSGNGAVFSLDSVLTGGPGDGTLVTGGSAAFATAYSGSSPIKPWEVGADYP